MSDLFRVSYSKVDNSYTLIQEGITLTEEQARQIATAYLSEKRLVNPISGIGEVGKLEEWIPNGNPKTYVK